jgi:hypothetical protein
MGTLAVLTPDQRTLFAVVRLSNVSAYSVISASWFFNDTPLRVAASSVLTPGPYPAGYVAFRLDRGDERGWPEGRLSVQILLDGVVARAAEIEIRSSPP